MCLLTSLPLLEGLPLPFCILLLLILLSLQLLNSFALVLLSDGLVKNAPFFGQLCYALVNIVKVKMAASLRTLVGLPTIVFLLLVLAKAALEATVVEHVQTDEVRHLVVHDFTLAQLKCQILVVFVSRRFFISTDKLKIEIGRVIENIGANCQKA